MAARPWRPPPARLDPTRWRDGLLAALPPLAASLLCAGRASGRLPFDGAALGAVGLALIGALLATSALGRRLGWASHAAGVGTAGALGLVAPTLALHVGLAGRASIDPVPIVLLPATATLALLAAGLATAAAVLAGRPAAASVGPALLPALGLGIWAGPLSGHPDEPLIWAALALTFGLAALAWFATAHLAGWAATLPTAMALLLLWALALTVPTAPSTPTPTGLLQFAQVCWALLGTLALLGIAPAAAAWRRWRP